MYRSMPTSNRGMLPAWLSPSVRPSRASAREAQQHVVNKEAWFYQISQKPVVVSVVFSSLFFFLTRPFRLITS
jgi:hypothetical protein